MTPEQATPVETSNVLVVEDNPGQRETLCDILELEGFHTLACGSATEADQVIGRQPLAVAILDLRLPDRPGTHVLERLRAADDQVQVIIHTGYGSFASAKDSVNLGAFAYLEKPTDPEELVRQVHRAAEHWMRLALRQSEERYKVLTELSPVGIFHADAGGAYRWVNRRWSEIAGLGEEEARGDGWLEGLDPADRDRVLEEWRATVAAGHGFSAEFRFRRGDGETAWVYGQARPQHNGKDRATGYVGTITDITERKRTEESLRLLEAALEQALLPVAVTSADAEDPRFVYVNPAFAKMTGYREEELLGQSPTLLHGLKTGRTTVEQLNAALRQGRSFVGDLINYRKDGSTFAIEWRLDPVRDGEGRITHWVAIFR